MSTIWAFEGPSGSGKGYSVEQFTNGGKEFIVPIRPVLPRCLDNWAGAWTSSFLEYQAIAAATMSQKDVCVDRFLISRWIYRAMQFNNNILTDDWYEEMKRSFRRLKVMAVAEAWDRMGRVLYMHPTVELIVLLPSLNKLDAQRAQTGKEYPFDAYYESLLYCATADRLIQDPIQGVTVTIVRS